MRSREFLVSVIFTGSSYEPVTCGRAAVRTIGRWEGLPGRTRRAPVDHDYWRSCRASPGPQSGNGYVPTLGGKPPFLRSQVRVPYGDDDREVVAGRAALQPDPTEANSLERRPGNPDRREEVTVEAPHHDVAAHVVAETPTHDRSSDHDHHQEEKRGNGLRRHLLGVLAEALCRKGPWAS